jgi:hypothetical protein
MKHLAILVAAVAIAGVTPARAQVTQPPLSITSPLGLGPAAAVPPVGVPLGATQLPTAGVSPIVTGSVPQSAITGSNTACGGSAALTTGISDPTALFDAGMGGGNASGTCATMGGALARPTASASSPTGMGSVAVGRVGIPMGSTELGVGGLSPPPDPTSVTSSLGISSAVPSTPLVASPSTAGMNPLSPQTSFSSGASCIGAPGNINSTGISAGSSAGIC